MYLIIIYKNTVEAENGGFLQLQIKDWFSLTEILYRNDVSCQDEESI